MVSFNCTILMVIQLSLSCVFQTMASVFCSILIVNLKVSFHHAYQTVLCVDYIIQIVTLSGQPLDDPEVRCLPWELEIRNCSWLSLGESVISVTSEFLLCCLFCQIRGVWQWVLGLFFSSSSAFPSYISGGSPFWGEILRTQLFFNPTIEEVTFHFHG